LPKPYAGLVGSLGPTLDFALLNILAENLRASIIVIGEPTGGLSSADRKLLQLLRRKTNVYFLGKRPTAVLAQYIAACDVCLAPYKQNERVYASSPLKYWQYLALGKPVVTTPVAELEDLEPLVRVARDYPSFVDAVRRILDCPEDAQVARRRRQYAASNTWEVRWQSLREFLKSVPTLSVLAD
jgi:glycosyltransferase involved in cell wall biosynthesis